MTKDGTWERLAKSAPWAQRERWAFKEKIAKKERRESLEEAPKIVWKIPSFRLGRVCPTLFPSTLHGYSVHAWEVWVVLSCISVNSWLSHWEWRKKLAFCKLSFYTLGISMNLSCGGHVFY